MPLLLLGGIAIASCRSMCIGELSVLPTTDRQASSWDPSSLQSLSKQYGQWRTAQRQHIKRLETEIAAGLDDEVVGPFCTWSYTSMGKAV